MNLTVRYFAAARAAAGHDQERLDLDPDDTVADVVDRLSARDGALAQVLARCSFLSDGVAVRDPAMALRTTQVLDVLPPFAGG